MIIPAGVSSIGDSAFSDCWRLKVLELSEGLTAIGEYAFSGCALVLRKNTYISDPINIDATLTEIMRQDKESGVLILANMAREGAKIPYGKYKDCNVMHLSDIKSILEYSVILCYKNSTRRRFNKAVRRQLNIKATYPIKNEKLICLKNNYFHELEYLDIPIFPVNGLNCIAMTNAEDYKFNNSYLKLKYRPDFVNDDLYFDTLCEKRIFETYLHDDEKVPVIIDTQEDAENQIVHLDFAYAITTHRAQGTEYDGKVLIIDDYEGDPDVYNKFLYTSISRAKNKVDIIKIL
jgi:exodeoxyribonuclease-5